MNRLQQLRKEFGYSQQTLANALDVNQTAVSQWERGVTAPSSTTLLKLCELLHTTSDYLLNISDNKEQIKWEDPFIIKEIDNMLAPLMNGILNIAIGETEENREILFNIFVEIKSILNIKDYQSKTMILDLVAGSIHNLNSNVNRYTNQSKKGGNISTQKDPK